MLHDALVVGQGACPTYVLLNVFFLRDKCVDVLGGCDKYALPIMALPSIPLYFPYKTLGIWKKYGSS